MNFASNNKFIFAFQPRVEKDNIFEGVIDFKFLSSQIANVNIPGISIGVVQQPTPITPLPQIGSGSKNFGDLNIQFFIDEKWETFKQIYKWLDIVYNKEIISKAIKNGQINATLILTDNFMSPQISLSFDNLFPFEFDTINLSTLNNNIEELSFNVTFKYNKYELQEV